MAFEIRIIFNKLMIHNSLILAFICCEWITIVQLIMLFKLYIQYYNFKVLEIVRIVLLILLYLLLFLFLFFCHHYFFIFVVYNTITVTILLALTLNVYKLLIKLSNMQFSYLFFFALCTGPIITIIIIKQK